VKLALMLRMALGERAPADSRPEIYGVQWVGLQLFVYSMSWVMRDNRKGDDYYACTQVFQADLGGQQQGKHAILRAIVALRFLVIDEIKAHRNKHRRTVRRNLGPPGHDPTQVHLSVLHARFVFLLPFRLAGECGVR
jgi:hypothetical protein